MADIIEPDSNCKPVLVLAQIKEIDELKEKQKLLETKNGALKKSLEFAHEGPSQCRSRRDDFGVEERFNKSVNSEKKGTVKLETHSRRNG